MYRLEKTESLDHTALRAAAAGAVCGALGVCFAAGPAGFVRWLGPLAITAAIVRGTWKERALSMLFALAGLAGMWLWPSYPLFADAVMGALLGLALVRETDAARRRDSRESTPLPLRLAVIGLALVAWPLALRAVAAVEGSVLAQALVPPMALAALAGALVGLVTGLAAAPAHADPKGDPVADALRRTRPSLDGALRDLVLRIVEARGRALRLLDRSRAEGASRTETRRGLDGVALTAIELTDRFASVDRVLSRTPLASVEERSTALRAQLAATSDAGVKRDLERALASLDDQRAQIERLMQGRARLVARLESELASLEKTEMALALLASGDAAMSGLRLEGIGAGLARQASDLEAEGSALQEALTSPPSDALARVRAG